MALFTQVQYIVLGKNRNGSDQALPESLIDETDWNGLTNMNQEMMAQNKYKC